MKLDRMISILVVLLRRQKVQSKELADMFDVSVRTILRDVDALNIAGIPIVTYQGANGGIGIAEGFRIDKSVLSSDDMAAIITALRGVAGTIPDSRHQILMEKFKNTLSQSQLDSLHSKTDQLIIDLSPWGGNGAVKKVLEVLKNAIEDHCEITFNYIDSEGNRTSRKIEPYSLLLKGQKWYLYGWCLIRQGFRLFKLSRIREINVTEVKFTPRDISVDEMPWNDEWNSVISTVEFELLFDNGMEGVVQEWFGDEAYTADDGKIMVRTMLPENSWVYGFILSFGPGVEIIKPLHVRETIKNMAEEIYKRYL